MTIFIKSWSIFIERWLEETARYKPVTELDLNDVSKSQFLSLHLKYDVLAAKSCVEFNDIVSFESWEFEKCAFDMKFIDRLEDCRISRYLCWIFYVYFHFKFLLEEFAFYIKVHQQIEDSHISCYLCWIFETLKAQIILWSHW